MSVVLSNVALLTDREAAEKIGCPVRTVREARWRGGLKFLRIGKTILVREADLLAYMERRGRGRGILRHRVNRRSRKPAPSSR